MTVLADESLRRLLERAVYTPLSRGSAVTNTVARLGRAIGMGLLRPHDRLPPEAQLAGYLGISPVTLRSALAILRSGGLIETSRGRGGGTYVSEHAASRGVPGDQALPSPEELGDLAAYRTVIEGGVAWLAAECATAEQISYLDGLLTEMEGAGVGDIDAWGERDTLFHLILADAAGSQRLMGHVADIRGEVVRLARLGAVPAAVMRLADREHRDILRAVAARRPARARDAMVRHVASTGALWVGLRSASATATTTSGEPVTAR